MKKENKIFTYRVKEEQLANIVEYATEMETINMPTEILQQIAPCAAQCEFFKEHHNCSPIACSRKEKDSSIMMAFGTGKEKALVDLKICFEIKGLDMGDDGEGVFYQNERYLLITKGELVIFENEDLE